MTKTIKQKLEEIKESILNENISYGEIAYLQDHQCEVLEMGDIMLAEWAGIPEESLQFYFNERTEQ